MSYLHLFQLVEKALTILCAIPIAQVQRFSLSNALLWQGGDYAQSKTVLSKSTDQQQQQYWLRCQLLSKPVDFALDSIDSANTGAV